VVFVLYTESSLIISLIYPSQYSDAIWMQKYLVWTIPLSFQNNLFSYVMMVSGAVKVLLLFQVIGTIVNFILNFTLVPMLKLQGACLAIILTKLLVACLTFFYCRVSLGFVRFIDFFFPFCLGIVSASIFVLLKPFLTLHPSVAITVVMYFALLFGIGPKFIGHFPRKTN